jgi:hypothetical protein
MSSAWSQFGQNLLGSFSGYNFGRSVSFNSDGSIVAIGANGANSNIGVVQIYQYSSGTWSQLGNNINGVSSGEQLGYQVRLSSNGSIVAIGALGYNGYTGLVRIYQFISGTWSQLGADIIGPSPYSAFSGQISLNSDGSIVAIGALGYNSNTGLVQIYQYTSGSWTQLGSTLNGTASNNLFGISLSLSSDGNKLAIGASGNNSDTGLLQIYQYTSGNWSQVGGNLVGLATNNQFGVTSSLSSDGTIVAIGATGNNSNTGLVQIYQYTSGNWTQIGGNILGPATGSVFGCSLFLSSDGSKLAISASGYNSNTGLVQMYQYTSGTWTQIGGNILGPATNSLFGLSLSLSSDGTRIVSGAFQYNSNTGLVQTYQQPQSPTINFPNMNNYLSDASFTLNPSSNSGGSFSYTSSNTGVASVSGNIVTLQQPGITTITATQTASGDYTSGSATAYLNIMNNICFPGGTPITCDQGNIPIDQLNPKVHTIRGKKIVAITQTITPDKFLVCFEKDSLGANIPSQKTLISKKHKVFYKGKMMEAQEFIGKFDTVYRLKYTGEILYNVLMEKYEKMMVNNLICETLHPENIVARLYTGNYSPSEFNEIVLSMNECVKKQDRSKFLSICKTLK